MHRSLANSSVAAVDGAGPDLDELRVKERDLGARPSASRPTAAMSQPAREESDDKSTPAATIESRNRLLETREARDDLDRAHAHGDDALDEVEDVARLGAL